MKNSDVQLRSAPIRTIQSDGEIFYQARTLCSGKVITQDNWAISHVSMGSGQLRLSAGHSVIFVEGIVLKANEGSSHSLFLLPRLIPHFFVGRYHLVKPASHKEEKQEQEEEHEVTVTVDNREYFGGYAEHWCDKFDQDPTASFFVDAQDAKNMIASIYEDIESILPYHFAGASTRIYDNRRHAHNCCTWALEKLKIAGVDATDGKFNVLKAKPKFNLQ